MNPFKAYKGLPSPKASSPFWLFSTLVVVTLALAWCDKEGLLSSLSSSTTANKPSPFSSESDPSSAAALPGQQGERPPKNAAAARRVSTKPTARPIKLVGHRIFEKGADQPAVCFASMEWNCFTTVQGGLGRAFLGQAASLIRDAEHPVRALFVPFQGGERRLGIRCPGDPDAEALAPYITEIDLDIPWFQGVSASYPPMLLLEWIRKHPNACRVLHVPDWNGFGVYVALAARAGLPEFRNLHVNVQVHGAQFQLSLGGLQDSLGAHDLVRAAQERLALEHASSVTFLNRESFVDVSALSRVSRNVYIIPNILEPIPETRQKQPPPMGRPVKLKVEWIIFYGKLTMRKGFHLFMRSLGELAKKEPAFFRTHKVRVIVIGPIRMDTSEVRDMSMKLFTLAGTFPIVRDKWNRWEVLDFFIQHARDAVVVLPSYYEVQSYALFDVMQSGIPFIASNISAHRAQIPATLHNELLVTGSENEFADRLKALVENGVDWQPIYYALPYNAREKWRAWHKKVMVGEGVTAPVIPSDARNTLSLDRHELRIGRGGGESRSASTQPNGVFAPSLGALFPNPPPVTVVISACERITFALQSVLSVAKQTYGASRIRTAFVAACPGTVTCQDVLQALETVAVQKLSLTCMDADAPRVSIGRIRTEATARAATDLVMFLDANDELPPDAVANYVRAALLNPQRAVFASFADTFVDEDEESSQRRKPPAPGRSALKRFAVLGSSPEAALLVNTMGAYNIMVNKSAPFWKSSGGFSDQPGVGCEDWELLAKAALVDEVQLVPARGLWARQDKGSTAAPVEKPPRDHILTCRFRVIQGALHFADRVGVKMNHYRWTTLMQYILTFFERFDGEKEVNREALSTAG